MATFKDILDQKYEQIDEAGTPIPGQNPSVAPIVSDPNAANPQQTQQQQQQPGPEQSLVQAFQSMDFKNGETSTEILNTAMKNLNSADAAAFWQNVGYDPTQGFVYQQAQPQQGATPQTTAAQQAGQSVNSATTTTAAQSQAARAPSIGA